MHKTIRCTCGRLGHYPATAKRGDQWECWTCGKVWTIVPPGQGKPLRQAKSKAPTQKTQVIVMPVIREVVRDSLCDVRQTNPFLPQQFALPAPTAERREVAKYEGLFSWLARIFS